MLHPLCQYDTCTCYGTISNNNFAHGNTYSCYGLDIVIELFDVTGVVCLERQSSRYRIRGAFEISQ